MTRPDRTRLERGEGPNRYFWEIARSGDTVTTRTGKVLSAGRTSTRSAKDEAEAKALFAKLVRAKRGEGYEDPAPKSVAGESSKHGVSVRNAELEAVIEANPEDPEGYLVYADWLQQQGDVRGELIVVQHQREAEPDDARVQRAEDTLFRTFEPELLGPLARYAFIRLSAQNLKAFAWRRGFIHAARLRRIAETPLDQIVGLLLGHPSGRFVERLALGRASHGSDEDLDEVFRFLARGGAPRTLTELVVGDGYASVGDLGTLWSAMPGLRSLAVVGSCRSFGTRAPDRLERLHLAVRGGELFMAGALRWPALTSLHVTLDVLAAEHEANREALASGGFPALRALSVRRWATNANQRLAPQDALAHGIVKLAIARKLETLALEIPLTESGARALLPMARDLAPIALAIPWSAVPVPEVRTKLEAALPRLVWTDDPEEADLADVDRSRDPWPFLV